MIFGGAEVDVVPAQAERLHTRQPWTNSRATAAPGRSDDAASTKRRASSDESALDALCSTFGADKACSDPSLAGVSRCAW